MFQNAAFDIAVGLALMYLMLSLVCTVINEAIATSQNLRSKSLAAGLKELLDDPVVRNAFYAHGSILATTNAVAKGDQLSMISGASAAPAAPVQQVAHPSYISADTFVLALLGSLTALQAQGAQVPTFANVQLAIQNLPSSNIKSALLASLMTADGDFNAFRKNVATWFDDSMDRLSGAYKRHMKVLTIMVGCAVAVSLNADTFGVGSVLWSDGTLRSQMVQVADATSKATPPPNRSNDGQTTPPATGEAGQSKPTIDSMAAALTKANQTLRPLPIGWTEWPPRVDDGRSAWWFWLVKVLGWLVTGLALSMGAPFWFDMLSKLINIRGTGVKPVRQDQK